MPENVSKSTINVPAGLADLLGGLKVATDLRNSEGHIIGTFVPSVPSGKCPWTEEELVELERASREEGNKGRTLREIWRDLGREGYAECNTR